MLKYFKISDGRLIETEADHHQVMVVVAPDDTERRLLVEGLKLDEHTFNSSLDPDELARLEFEPDHTALIMKSPKNYSSGDNFLFKVISVGLFLFRERLVIVLSENLTLFEGRQFQRVISVQDVALRLLFRTIVHFTEHLRAINAISEELEQQINQSMENRYLLNMFTLEKSLVYYLRAINSNGMVVEKLKINAAKLGFTPESLEFLDDLMIENNQCYRQAEIYSNILASLMDARASIVANNLNQLIKTLTLITITIMLPTMVVSIFSMNFVMPFHHDNPVAFWVILGMAMVTGVIFWFYWRYKKW